MDSFHLAVIPSVLLLSRKYIATVTESHTTSAKGCAVSIQEAMWKAGGQKSLRLPLENIKSE